MNYDQLWTIVMKNASHIETFNREMGVVQSQVIYIRQLIMWMLGCMSATFLAVLATLMATFRNIWWTKKANGNGKTK